MFNKIRRRLVILNAVVFLLVLSVLSSFLYLNMRYRLFRDTDELLSQAKAQIKTFHDLEELLRSDETNSQQDERTTYLFWNPQGELIGQSPRQSFSQNLANQFSNTETAGTPHTITADKHSYRVLKFSLHNQGSEEDINNNISVGIVRSMVDINHTLRSLMLDIIIGIIAGLIISILAGLFLARRALVPIRNSWEKQQQFVADASHELRTPVAVIHARTELLFRHPAHSIEQESSNIAVILNESKQMGKLLDDLLTLARSDSNQQQIQSSTIAIDALLRNLSEQFQLLASTKDVEIITELQEPLSLWGDEARIRQLLIILLDNALKYTSSAGRITLTSRYQAHSVYISVSDEGCGIPEEELPHVFERFYRGDKVRSRTEGGTGLGLSIAQWIVDEHGGVIHIDSKVNVGTRVEVLFPRKNSNAKH